MAKRKGAKSRPIPKSQRFITSFFSGIEKKAPPLDTDVTMESANEIHPREEDDASEVLEDGSSDVVMGPPNAPARNGPRLNPPDASNLPPINEIPAMFDDLVSKIPEIQQVVEHVQGRKLRVATMCSGTESPLLAMELIRDAISKQYGLDFPIEHVFSCEIEPFKQAYIERNFQPPLLFRDVCELGGDQAHTAYGSLVPVPGNVDMLIAGTSCVDYSNLNKHKKKIDDDGQSGRTFRGMISWVEKHRPPIVILENLRNAPWKDVKTFFEYSGYSATLSLVDTKNYYIPHTRTRGYLIAVHQLESPIPAKWEQWVKTKLKRPTSSTLDTFLLTSDDLRVHQARQKLVRENSDALGVRQNAKADWGRCESRHQQARYQERLGQKRPLTNWDEGGFCKVPDFAWNDWASSQVERVCDLMDICYLRSAMKGIDPNYKTLVWNLSQNVDRNIGSNKTGISPCLTPAMIPYITNRGGPMLGLEALSMQGLPIDKLLLTRESEKNLADLAGNAMSTTVVGACILAALVTAKSLLKQGSETKAHESRISATGLQAADVMDVDISPPSQADLSLYSVVGEEKLVERSLDLSSGQSWSFADLLVEAEKAQRLCSCEGQTDITARPLFRCEDCGTTSCKKCGGRPEHNPQPIITDKHSRICPSAFATTWKAALPMCISLMNVNQELLDTLRAAARASIHLSIWPAWCAAVIRATTSELRFVEIRRHDILSVIYQSPDAKLELMFRSSRPEWRLYAVPEATTPANAEIRHILEYPIGRLICDNHLLEGRWHFALPSITSISVKIQGTGDLVPSWQARLGLVGEEFENQKVYSSLMITVEQDDISKLDRDISGVYQLLEKCGTANGALHKKVDEGANELPPLFMLFDPHRTNDSEDCFVFSTSIQRLEYQESRPIICKLDSAWRQSSNAGEEVVSCRVPVKWVLVDSVCLRQLTEQDAIFGTPSETLEIPASKEACSNAYAVLTCKVHLRRHAGPEWPLRGDWVSVDKIHERNIFRALAWFLERVRHVNENFESWQQIDAVHDNSNCERCAPRAPKMCWMQSGNKMVAVEDPAEAGEYERRLKARPSPFVTQLKLADGDIGLVRVGVNIPSLIHRAVARLPTKNRHGEVSLSWRLDTNFTPAATPKPSKFTIMSNKADKKHSQPPSFKIDLREEQLRSLEWMIRQESHEAFPFIEEEISEAVLEPLGWRAEGRARRSVHVRGGVLADQVGYGKTAITLGLIDCTSDSVTKEFSKKRQLSGKINTKATLIIVPPHLTKQWNSEIKKFSGNRFKTLVLETVANLNPKKIEDFQDADIIVVASNLFHSPTYLDNLRLLAGTGELPSSDGRHFDTQLAESLRSLRSMVDLLREEGSLAVLNEIRQASKKSQEKATRAVSLPSELEENFDSGTATAVERGYEAAPEALEPEAQPKSHDQVHAVPDSNVRSEGTGTRKRKCRASGISVSSSDNDNSGRARKGQPSKPLAKKPRTVAGISAAGPRNSAASSQGNSRKGKGAAIAKSKLKQEVEELHTTENDMDVDGPINSPEPKRKATKKQGAKGTPDAKVTREDKDPWKLGSKDTRKNWASMRAPCFEMFHFARIVVDEYTYLDGKVHALVTSLSADRQWVLSGTPPIYDFGALKTIAEFLDIHLGVEDLDEGQSAEAKKRLKEQTSAELFHSFREVHTMQWHVHRHDVGQRFLNQFVRQNIAEIDEIAQEDKIEIVVLPAAERAIYLELEHHLLSLDMTIKRGKKSKGDKEERLAQSLGESKSAEEALLKRCSHFYLETSNENDGTSAEEEGISTDDEGTSTEDGATSTEDEDTSDEDEGISNESEGTSNESEGKPDENAIKACRVIVRKRKEQLQQCEKNLLKAIKNGVKHEKKIGFMGQESLFVEQVRILRTGGVEDKEAGDRVIKLLDKAGAEAPAEKPKPEKVTLTQKQKAIIWKHRERAHLVRRLAKELAGRCRSLRFIQVVRDLQDQTDRPSEVSCASCKKTLPLADIAILSSCGHTGCLSCVTHYAGKEECIYAASGNCKSPVRAINIVKAEMLGVDDVQQHGRGRHFGVKLESVVDLIKRLDTLANETYRNRIPQDERVLVFVQFSDLMKKVAEAFKAHFIEYLQIEGSATQKSKNLEKFQNGSAERVLLIEVMEQSASGANLTCANHAIFLSPLLTLSQDEYIARETQAVGRLVRYGQTKPVTIWRFITENTIDEQIYRQRTPHS